MQTKENLTKSIERVMQKNAEGLFYLNPDNHDQIGMAIGLLNAESAESISKSINNLIESNKKTDEINKKAIFWNKIMTIALIGVTLVVGLLQAYVIWSTSK